jgi:hypothetical protein
MKRGNTSIAKPNFLKKKKEVVLPFDITSALFISASINPIALNQSKDFIN